MKQLFSLFLATNVFLLSSVHAKQAELHYEPIPVPHLDKEKIHLKVAYVVNPHFDELPLTAIKEMLKETKRMAQEHFGLNISFEFPKRLLIKELFDQIPQKIKDHIQPMIIDISKETINPKAFKSFSKALKVALMENPTSLDEEFAFAKPYLSKKLESISDLDQLVFALTKTLFERVKKLQKFFGNDSYNEWLYWVSLGYTKMPYDLIITNQPIISVENVGVDIHPALRGGITMGAIDYKKNSPFGAFAFWSTFGFFQKDTILSQLRGGDYTYDQAITLCGAYLTHELGHMFFHYDHPFGAKACVMNPVPLLDVQTWYKNLDAKACRKGSFKAMQPGALKLYKIKEF